MASNCTVSPVQIVVVVRFVKLITGGVPIVTTTKPVGAPSQELPFKALIATPVSYTHLTLPTTREE